ncbi:MAG: hypothetical protein F6K14_06350 [Symploca sp. SIO2C1]|nr:hypothetical protein [Symploca sp. SIO2C1]
MSGNVIDSSSRALLILIVPIALLAVLFLKAWPLVVALLVITISFQVWQQYQWQQWSKQVNPFFNRLIKDNQGCLTPLDLSIKASISGAAAKQYLDKRAEEFGAQRQVYEDQGTVYYFLTANALGSIFDESEPLVDLENEFVTGEVVKRIEALKPEEPTPEVGESPTDEPPTPLESSASQEQPTSQSLIQGELAKRLDVHSSTVGKHKSDPDFPQWSQSRDPQGIAWEYSAKTKEFSPIEQTEEA